MNLDIVDGHDWHKFDLKRCQVNFIYMALIYSKSYLMTLFNWSRFRTYTLIANLPSISPHEEKLGARPYIDIIFMSRITNLLIEKEKKLNYHWFECRNCQFHSYRYCFLHRHSLLQCYLIDLSAFLMHNVCWNVAAM